MIFVFALYLYYLSLAFFVIALLMHLILRLFFFSFPLLVDIFLILILRSTQRVARAKWKQRRSRECLSVNAPSV